MQVAPQPEEPVVVSEQPTQHFSPELGLGTAASNVADVVDALTVGGLLDLIPGSEPRYVGVKGAETPVCAEEPVVDVVGVDRKLFDAANAAKARTHFCWGMPGSLAGVSYDPLAMISQPQGFLGGFAEDLCCVPPWVCTHLSLYVLFCTCSVLGNTLCCRHEDMEFPPWAGAALVMTDKGVIGRRHMRPDKTPEKQAKQQASYARFNEEVPPHARDVNAIAWDGLDVDKIEVRRYAEDKDCYWNCDEPPLHPDPLSYALGFGFLGPCCWKVLRNPTTPGLYRARIKSDHTTTVSSGDSSEKISTARIDVIALARSPEDLLESLRAAKAKYHAPAAAAMERSDAPPAKSGPKVSVRCSVM